MPTNTLLITNARLADGSAAHIHVGDGKITAITPAGSVSAGAGATTPRFDAAFDLVLPGFVEGHCHLDKT